MRTLDQDWWPEYGSSVLDDVLRREQRGIRKLRVENLPGEFRQFFRSLLECVFSGQNPQWAQIEDGRFAHRLFDVEVHTSASEIFIYWLAEGALQSANFHLGDSFEGLPKALEVCQRCWHATRR